MKNGIKTFLKSVLCVAVSASMTVSCYDDSAIWDKLTDVENRLFELEVELSNQIDALSAIVSDLTTVSGCVKNADGSYTVTLSNGTKFNVFPQGTDFSSLVTYKVVNGTKYWATMDPNGESVVLTDASGKNIPVSADISVKLVDGVYYLVVNGKEFPTGYHAEDVVSVFSSCTPLADASGNVYAVKFTFGEGMEVTVALDGYKGVIFKLSNVNSSVVSEYFIDYGKSQDFLMEMNGVEDYVMQVPDGWRVKEINEELTGETYIRVIAPKAETVALGAAVADGYLKVVSVVEGGKAAISKMYLSTDPFKTYDVSSMNAVIVPYAGIQKFAYGVMPSDDFNEKKIVAKVNEILSASGDLPEGYYVADAGINKTIAEIFGGEITAELACIFWAIPALYEEEGEDVGFYVKEDMLRTRFVSPVSATVNVGSVSLLDAEVTVNVKGAKAMYAGVTPVVDNFTEEIVYQINNGIIDPTTEGINYSGPVSGFPTEEAAPYLSYATKYAVWVVPVDEEKETYTVNDIVYKEFTTKDIAAGGSAVLTAGDFTTTASSIKSTVSSEGAAMIYYAYLSEIDGKRYSTQSNEVKAAKLMEAEKSTLVRGSSADALVKGLRPETTMWLYAMAIDNNGLYGEVVCKSAKTGEVKYNNLSVSIADPALKSNSASFQISVTGGTATEFIYWCGYSQEQFWVNENYCGGNRTKAQAYLAANPDADEIQKVMRANGNIAEDGSLTIRNLTMSTTYVFIVLAKDETGNYSTAAYKKFTTLAADLGDMVEEGTQRWEEAKSQVKLEWIEQSFAAAENSNMSARYAFKYSGPTNLTAFVLCASDSYFEGAGLLTAEQQIVNVENTASRRYDDGYTPRDENGNLMSEPDYYKNGVYTQGQLMNAYKFYVHGLPSLGFATYFANGDHDGNCIYWDADQCTNYERAKERIAYYNTITPYKDKASMFGLKGEEAEKWAQDLMEAYSPFYKDAEPIVYYNDGTPLTISNPYGMGVNDEGKVVDRVVVVFRDLDGNYFAPMTFEVPNYFK